MIFELVAAVSEAATEAVGSPDYTALFVKMVALLAVIIILGFVVVRYISPVGRTRGGKFGKGFELLAVWRLEAKKSIYLVRIGGRRFALGASESGLNLIAEINEEDLKS